jgi:hypothetical protein
MDSDHVFIRGQDSYHSYFYQEYNIIHVRGREREYHTQYCCVQTPFAKNRGQLVHDNHYYTYTATSCSLALQGWCCGHTPECVTITAVLAFIILASLTSVLGKGCLHTAIHSTILSFPPLINISNK